MDTTEINSIKAQIDFILNLMIDANVPAVVGGGVLRDLTFGVQPKDIDVFVPYEYKDAAHEIIQSSYGDFKIGISMQNVDEVSASFEYPAAYPSEIPVNLIIMTEDFYFDIATVVERFDFGLSQIAVDNIDFDLEYPFTTRAFIEDVNAHVFRVVNPEKSSRAAKRFERISARYPEFAYINEFEDDDLDWDDDLWITLS